MKEYPHIDSVYKRGEKGKFLIGDWSTPEFEYLKDNPWFWTEKVDGTNIRVMWESYGGSMDPHMELRFGGKTDGAQIPSKLVNWLNANITSQSFFDACLESSLCLYGEGYGAGIQSGGNYAQEQKFVLFDVKIGDWWLQRADVEDIARKLNLEIVPLAYGGETRTLNEAIDDIKNGGFKSKWGDFIAEGLVGQPLVPLRNRRGNRVITKVKVKDFK